MRLKFPIRRIVEKHIDEVAAWREAGAPWCEIAAALAPSHPGVSFHQDSVRKAWISLFPQSQKEPQRLPKKVSENRPETLTKKRDLTAAPFIENSQEFSRIPEKVSENRPVTIVQTPSVVPATAAVQTAPKTAKQEHAELLAFREAARREKNLKTFASAFD